METRGLARCVGFIGSCDWDGFTSRVMPWRERLSALTRFSACRSAPAFQGAYCYVAGCFGTVRRLWPPVVCGESFVLGTPVLLRVSQPQAPEDFRSLIQRWTSRVWSPDRVEYYCSFLLGRLCTIQMLSSLSPRLSCWRTTVVWQCSILLQIRPGYGQLPWLIASFWRGSCSLWMPKTELCRLCIPGGSSWTMCLVGFRSSFWPRILTLCGISGSTELSYVWEWVQSWQP